MSDIVLTQTGFAEPSRKLSPVAPGYPVTIKWPDGDTERYYNRGQLAYAVHTRLMVKEALELGGVVSARAD